MLPSALRSTGSSSSESSTHTPGGITPLLPRSPAPGSPAGVCVSPVIPIPSTALFVLCSCPASRLTLPLSRPGGEIHHEFTAVALCDAAVLRPCPLEEPGLWRDGPLYRDGSHQEGHPGRPPIWTGTQLLALALADTGRLLALHR